MSKFKHDAMCIASALHGITAITRHPFECMSSKGNGRYIARRIAIVREHIAELRAYAASPDANPHSPAQYVAVSYSVSLELALRELRGK